MPHVIYVDSAFSRRGTDSDFQIQLLDTIKVEDARMRIDKLSFADTFNTITNGVNQYLYINDSQNIQSWFALPQQAYTGKQLAAATQVATGLTSTYFEQRNEIRVTMPTSLHTIMTDTELSAMPPSPTVSWPEGAGPNYPMSINNILGVRRREGNDVVFPVCEHEPLS